MKKSFSANACNPFANWRHQIVVVDTGSTDRTVEIAKEHGAEVFQFAWSDDFSAARNAALEHVTGDWVLSLDADEELLSEHRETILQEMQAAIRDGLAFADHQRQGREAGRLQLCAAIVPQCARLVLRWPRP